MERRDGGGEGSHTTVTFAKPFDTAELLTKVAEMLGLTPETSRQSCTG